MGYLFAVVSATEAAPPQDRPAGLAHSPQIQRAWAMDFLSLWPSSCCLSVALLERMPALPGSVHFFPGGVAAWVFFFARPPALAGPPHGGLAMGWGAVAFDFDLSTGVAGG